MTEVFEKLGVNWKLLLAQAVNFGLLVLVLRFTVYQPLLTMLADRKRKIEQGFKDAEEAGQRLREADEVKKIKLREAEAESLLILKTTEEKSKVLEAGLLEAAHRKESDILTRAQERGERLVGEETEKFYAEAADIVRRAISKVIESKREIIDDHLIKETVKKLKESSL